MSPAGPAPMMIAVLAIEKIYPLKDHLFSRKKPTKQMRASFKRDILRMGRCFPGQDLESREEGAGEIWGGHDLFRAFH